jgi:hypothetical protein
MARVPVVQGPQVETRALNTPMQGSIDVSSGLQAASRALGQLGQIADQRLERDTAAEADTADTEITAGWLEWDAKARRQFQGANIGEYEAGAAEWWSKTRETYGKNLSPAARQRLAQALARKHTAAMGSVAQHAASVREQWADTQAEASAQSTIEFGIDTGDTAGAAARVRQLAAEKGARKGWSTEMVQAEQQRLLGTLHLSYITRLAQSAPDKARAYYDANKGEIPGTAQARVEEVLKAESDNQFAKTEAARLYALPADQRAAALAKINDPDRLAKTRVEMNNIVAVEKAAQQQREQAASDEAWQLVGQRRAVPEATLLRMNGRERVQLQDYLRDRAKAAAGGGGPVRTNPVELARIYDMARDNPEEFVKLRMEPLALTIASSDMEQVAKLQRDMRDPGKQKDTITSAQQIGSYARELSPQQRPIFQRAAHAEIIAFTDEKGRPPNQAERKEILDALVMEGVLEQSLLGVDWLNPDDKLKAYQMTPEQRAVARFPARAQQPADKFTAGKVYTDANGNRARYLGGGKWEPIK